MKIKRLTNLAKYGKWAAVAGAAEGLGAAFCDILAANGVSLIMIDVKADDLKATAARIKRSYSVQTESVEMDLSDLSNAHQLSEYLSGKGCRLIVYNAAYGPVKGFLQNSIEELEYYLNLNSAMPLRLAYHFSATNLGGDTSGFLLMSSMAGLRGTQLVTPYAATKAFDWNLMEGLYHEFRGTNLDFTACCAGPIDTPNYRSTGPKDVAAKPKDQDPALVASEALKGLGRKAVVLPGTAISLSETFLKHFMSRGTATKLANSTMARIYDEKWKKRFERD